MSDGFQLAKAQKAAGTLYGVNRAENACQQPGIFGALFQLDHLLVQTGQVFVALNQEFVDDLLVVHDCFTFRPPS